MHGTSRMAFWNCNTCCLCRSLHEADFGFVHAGVDFLPPQAQTFLWIGDEVADLIKMHLHQAPIYLVSQTSMFALRSEVGTVSMEVLCRPLSTNCLSFAFSPSLLVANFRFL